MPALENENFFLVSINLKESDLSSFGTLFYLN